MKVINHETNFNTQHTPNDSLPKISTVCGHKIELLLRRQNCHLPSFLCQQKCSHKDPKAYQYDQHQYCTQIELRKFMMNKIEHKNKGIMIQKDHFKQQIISEINHAEESLKQLKSNLMQQIDMLYYSAVKIGNNDTTAKGMEKFFSSQLQSLTCHEVYSLFSFKPLIDEKTHCKISSQLQIAKKQIVRMKKNIYEAEKSIAQRILTIQTGIQTKMVPENEENEEKNNFGKIRTNINSTLKPKQQQKSQPKTIQNKQIPIINQNKQPSMDIQQTQHKKDDLLLKKQEKQVNKEEKQRIRDERLIKQNQKQPKPFSEKVIQKVNEKSIEKQMPKPLTKQNAAIKPVETSNLDKNSINENHLLLEKCKMFETKPEQRQKPKDLASKQNYKLNDSLKQIPLSQKSVKEISSLQKTKILPDNQAFGVLLNNFKTLGSLSRVFATKEQRNDKKQKTTVPLQSAPNKRDDISSKKQTKIGNEEMAIKKTIFSDFKRTSDSYREKWMSEGNCEGRKIVKTGNDFPHSALKRDSPNYPLQNKMIPQPSCEKTVIEENKNIQPSQSINQAKNLIQTPDLTEKKLTQKVEIAEKTQKKIEKAPIQKQQIKTFSTSEKILLELVHQSSEKAIEQPQSKKDNLEIKNKQSLDSEPTPTFKAVASQQKIEKQNLDITPKQRPRQAVTTQKQLLEKKKQNSHETGFSESKRADQKEVSQVQRLFLAKPNVYSIQSQANQLPSSQNCAVPRYGNTTQTFDDGVKKIRLQNPGSNRSGRVCQNPIYTTLDLFQKGQQGYRQLQQKKEQKKQEYNKNSLMGEIERQKQNNSYGLEGYKQKSPTSQQIPVQNGTQTVVSNASVSDPSRQLSLGENKPSQKKFNYNGSLYERIRPSWQK